MLSSTLNDSPIIKADNDVNLGHYIGVDFIRNNIGNGVSKLIRDTYSMLSKFNSCDCDVKSFIFKTFLHQILW